MSDSGNKSELNSILLLGTQIAVGGAQRVLLSQAQWFYDKGYRVTTAFLYDKEKLSAEWMTNYPFPIVDLNARRHGANPIINGYLLLVGVYRLWQLIRQNKFNLIITYTPDSNIFGLFIAWFTGVSVRIGTNHGYIEGIPTWRRRLHGWIINHGLANCLIVVSKHLYQSSIEEEDIQPGRLVVIPNGIEINRLVRTNSKNLARIRRELDIDSDCFVYLSVGRLTEQKGHRYLLDAIPKVISKYPNQLVFIIAGEGYLSEKLEEKARDLNIDHVVNFLGSRSDIPDLLALADVFVMPSLSEGLPLALLEAMYVGLPVVASQVGGIKSIITHGENGYLVPPGNFDAISSALIDIRENYEARERFGNNNHTLIINEYTIDQMCSQYEDLFHQIFKQEKPE
jgi:glycosyltransferase involved in cell wall biosynthesis